MNPREWRNQFDVSINVGLGVGDKDQQISHLTLLQQTQAHAAQIGVATPMNLYESSAELVKAMGYKNPDRFFKKPDPNQPPPNPMQGEIQMKQMELQQNAQIEQMKAQMKAQADEADRQHQAQVEQLKAQYQAQVDQNRQMSEAQQHAAKIENEAKLAALQAQYADIAHQREQANQMEIERMKAQTQIVVARISAKEQESDMEVEGEAQIFQRPSHIETLAKGQQQLGENLSQMAGALHAMAQAHAKPKQIIRDANGRAQGIQ
jgi:hypothetical protein